MKVAVDTVALVVRGVDELEALGTDVPVALPQGSQLNHDGLLDGAFLEPGLGGSGESDGRVLQSDDLRLLDELLQVRSVLEPAVAVQGEHLEDGHHVTGEVVLGGHPDPPLASPQAGLQRVGVDEVHGPDLLAATVQDGLPVKLSDYPDNVTVCQYYLLSTA